MSETKPEPVAGRVTTLLRAAAAIVAAEGLAITAYGVYLMVDPLLSHADSIGRAEAGGALLLAMGASLFAVAYGLTRAKRWSRTPAVITQILAGAISWPQFQASAYQLGVPLLLAAVTGIILLFTPAVIRALTTH